MKLEDVYISPPVSAFSEVSEYSDRVPKRVVRAIGEGQDSLASGAYNSAATSAGRTLEGIMKDSLGQKAEGKQLWELIQMAADEIDFPKPMTDLALAIKEGRNRGAHFDPEIDIDGQSAEIMLSLVDSVIRYIYELPEQISSQIGRLDELREGNLDTD